jgi:PhoPQ-activated pathogenicity-related protein
LWFASLLAMVLPAVVSGQSVATVANAVVTKVNLNQTAIDTYVHAADPAYAWKVVQRQETPAGTAYVVDLTSQSWLTPQEVDRTLWKHWLAIFVPAGVTSDKALLFIGGGSNGKGPPGEIDERVLQIGMATKSVVAELGTIPNQPLIFHHDGVPRVEDDLIGYTWDQYLKTGDSRWPARLPMVKSVVRAMDTIQALLKSPEGGKHAIEQFIVAGGSKRGWTTWMTAAVDRRVAGIMPIVIDVLNVDVSMRHHYSAYGFWAPAVGDYVDHRIMQRRNNPRYQELLQLVDPFAYRDRFTMPKCIINASGDQFFAPDSSQFYFDELPGEKMLCYVPNADHSLNGSNALDTLVAFQYAMVNDIPRPEFSWKRQAENQIVVTAKTKPDRVLLWEATNEKARDFRVESIGRAYTSSELRPSGSSNRYVGEVAVPVHGWRAYFVQLEFDIGAPRPMRLSSAVQIVPDTLPFADREPPTDSQEQ